MRGALLFAAAAAGLLVVNGPASAAIEVTFDRHADGEYTDRLVRADWKSV